MYKQNIIRELVNIINGNLNYNYDGDGNICNIYMKANFKNEEFTTFESTDYIYGRVKDDINIKISKIALLNCNKSDEVINVADVFLFSYSEIKYNLPNNIEISQNKIFNKNKVDMDSEEFEKYFDVTTDSHILAMQILTHDVMEEIVKFYKEYGINFKIIMKENKIYIKFNTGDVFKPKLFKNVADNDLLWVYFIVLKFTISLSYKINKVLGESEIV